MNRSIENPEKWRPSYNLLTGVCIGLLLGADLSNIGILLISVAGLTFQVIAYYLSYQEGLKIKELTEQCSNDSSKDS